MQRRIGYSYSSLMRLSVLPRLARCLHPPGLRPSSLAMPGARLLSKAASGEAAGESASSSTASSDGSSSSGPGGEGGDDGLNEPIVARASRFIWNGIKLSALAAVFGAVLYSGYSIVTVLLPVGSSSNRIVRKASDILEGDPEVKSYFGQIKTYGMDLGGRNEGRRMFVPEYKYNDDLTGLPYHRVKFSLEGERSKKATVYAEVSSSTGEFRYLIVVLRDGSKVISITDRRPPVLTTEERQARVSTLLQDAGWVFLCDNEVDARQQGKVLGDYWLKVKAVVDGARLQGVGALSGSCGWVSSSGEVVAGGKGLKELAELESMVVPLARGDKPGFFAGLLPSFLGGDSSSSSSGGSPSPATQ